MSQDSIDLRIITPEGSLLEAESLNTVNVPLADGFPIGIRPGHAPLIAETKKGEVFYRDSNLEQRIDLHAGVLEIRENVVIILTPGEASTIPNEITKSSETEYDRLMNTLAEKFSLKQE